ncbi:MAG TPA: Hsp20/alpha crystallin family protein [Dongiaceae bacterium]|jgi:HSP20 family protein|nr:Hsp20/alpha crystallin family protein [Dongiaceae bacterium]
MNLIKFQRPSLSNWSGLRRLSDWQDEVDRLFEAPLARTAQVFGGWAPALDLYEDKDSFIIKAELPGVKKEDVKVSLENGTLTISGERESEVKAEEAEAHHVERYFGRFQRSLSLPTTVAADKVKAQYKDGVLTVTLPKTEAAKPKQIDVSVN